MGSLKAVIHLCLSVKSVVKKSEPQMAQINTDRILDGFHFLVIRAEVSTSFQIP